MTTRVCLLTRMAMGGDFCLFRSSVRAHGGDDFFCAVSHRIGWLNGKAALRQNLLALLDVRAFQAHDERHLQAELLGCRYDPFGDHVATHDAPEDVYED